MAAGILAQPGTAFGPCVEMCEHSDCGSTRAMAEAMCMHCDEPIGYDTRFYWIRNERYAHARCEERLIELRARSTYRRRQEEG